MQAGALIAGKYRVERLLGQGGMGFVFEATHVELDQLVALKTLAAETMTDEAIERFLREARAAARLRSQHIARVLDVGTLESGAPFMVLEHLDGRDLARHADASGPLPVPWVVDRMLQALEGIAEAHAAGIVHRDIKPGNLFLTSAPDGGDLVKVLDFGVSRSERPGHADLTLTRTATVVGSPAYMSPEQLRSPRAVDARSDIWSIGVSLYELVAGRLPFDAEVFGDLCVKIATEDPPPLLVAPAFAAVVARCLQRRPEDRFADVGELAAALAPLGEEATAGERAARIARLLGKPQRRPPAASAPPQPRDAVSTLDQAAGSKVTTQLTPPRRLRGFLAVAAGAAVLAGAVVLISRGDATRTAAAPPPVVVPIPVAAPPVPAPAVDAGLPDAATPVPRKRPAHPSPTHPSPTHPSPTVPVHDVYDSRH